MMTHGNASVTLVLAAVGLSVPAAANAATITYSRAGGGTVIYPPAPARRSTPA